MGADFGSAEQMAVFNKTPAIGVSVDPYGIGLTRWGLTRWQASLDVPTGPGLGFDPDPAFLRRHLYAAG